MEFASVRIPVRAELQIDRPACPDTGAHTSQKGHGDEDNTHANEIKDLEGEQGLIILLAS